MTKHEDDNDDQVINLSGWDRRQFGKILVAGVGALTLGKVASAAQKETCAMGPVPTLYSTGEKAKTQWNVDVVIVGAGLSGLIAARELKKAKKHNGAPITVLVVEANCRIGGRMYGQLIDEAKGVDGGYVDFGGQWVGETQYEMKSLAAELGITPFISYEKGRSVQLWNKLWKEKGKDDTKTGFNGDLSQLLEGVCGAPDHFPKNTQCEPSTLLPDCVHNEAEAKIWGKLLAISQTVIPDRPWDTPGATALDSITFEDWLKSPAVGATPGSYTNWLSTMQSRIGGSGGFEPSEVSLLHMAWTQRVGPQSETPEKWLLCGGAGQIPKKLADDLKADILLNAPVYRIDQPFMADPPPEDSREYVAVRVRNSETQIDILATAVIFAIPPPLRSQIDFRPALPNKYTNFMDKSPMGSISKVHAVYDNAFWRKECLSGSAAGNLETCEFIADSSRPCGQPGILTCFIAGDYNTKLIEKYPTSDPFDPEKAPKEIRDLVLQDFYRYFGDSRVLKPAKFFYFPWNSQPWTRGAFTTHLGPNVWTSSADVGWREPHGNIFWAGTETADRWPGYFDGAVRAGKMAALKVLEKLYWSQGCPGCWEPR